MTALPASGSCSATGSVGYLPQDPRTGDPEVLALHRILSARGLDDVVRRLREAEDEMGSDDPTVRDRGMRRYEKADAALHAGGGYAAEAEARQIASSLNIEDRILAQPLRTLSGGQRRRVELARILFSGAETLLLDEPTNHLDADSIVWLRDFLVAFKGGLIVISHDVGLLEACVNKVFHLDANRAEVDIYNIGWTTYLAQRETDEKRRKRERMNAENKAKTLIDQANKMRAKATKAQAAQSMLKRAERLMEGIESERRSDRVAKIKFPAPAPCGRTPLTAAELSKSYGSLEVFTDVDLAIDKGSRVVILGLNGAGKTTLLRILGGIDAPDTGAVQPGHGLKLGYYAQEHETLDTSLLGARQHAARGAAAHRHRGAQRARLVPVQRRRRGQAGVGALRRREDPAGAGDPGGLQRERAAARRADEQPRPGLPRGGARRHPHLPGRDHPGDPRRGCRRGAGARPGADPARRRRGPLERRLRRPGLARLTRLPDPGLSEPGTRLRRMTTGTVEQDVLAAGGLDFEENGLVATITLNRPETKNSQTPATWHALRIIGSSLSPDVRVVLVRGAGDTFSSGLDRRMLTPDGVDGEHGVMRMLDMPDPEMAESIATWQEGFTWLRRPDIVTVAVVRGAAVGAGFQLALACDLRVLAEDARFSMREPMLGLVPDLTGTKPLVDLVGYSRALEICATTRWVSADEAREIGLATAVVPAHELDDTVADLVGALTSPIYGAVTATKALLQSAGEVDLDTQRLAERKAQVRRFRDLASLMGE